MGRREGAARRWGPDPTRWVPEPWQDALPIPPLPTLAAAVVPQPRSQLLAAVGVNPFLNSLLSPLFLTPKGDLHEGDIRSHSCCVARGVVAPRRRISVSMADPFAAKARRAPGVPGACTGIRPLQPRCRWCCSRAGALQGTWL